MIANPVTISLQLFGAPQCHRYQKMHTQAVEIAAQPGLTVQLEEVSEVFDYTWEAAPYTFEFE